MVGRVPKNKTENATAATTATGNGNGSTGTGSSTTTTNADCDYKCNLSYELKLLASRELGEDDRQRQQSLQQFKQWIEKTAYIQNCRTDANFLLRFLRVKKFNMLLAQETLEKYIEMRQENSSWFLNTSLQDPLVNDLINKGVAFALPQRDNEGRRVMITIGGNIDPSYHTAESIVKAIMLTYETMLEDESTQINGFTHIFDESGIKLKHLTIFDPRHLAKLFTICEKAMPMRHKRIHLISLPTRLDYIYDFATKYFISSKVRDRIQLYKNCNELYDTNGHGTLSKEILPKEYCSNNGQGLGQGHQGQMSMEQMINAFKDEIKLAENRILGLDNGLKLDLDLMKKMKAEEEVKKMKNLLSWPFGIQGSFKQFNLD